MTFIRDGSVHHADESAQQPESASVLLVTEHLEKTNLARCLTKAGSKSASSAASRAMFSNMAVPA